MSGLGAAFAAVTSAINHASKIKNELNRRRAKRETKRKKREAEKDTRLQRYRQLSLNSEEVVFIEEIDLLTEEVNAPESKISCPECKSPFCLIEFDNLHFLFCKRCKSHWFSASEVSALTGEYKAIPADHLKGRPSKYSCLSCEQQMTSTSTNCQQIS